MVPLGYSLLRSESASESESERGRERGEGEGERERERGRGGEAERERERERHTLFWRVHSWVLVKRDPALQTNGKISQRPHSMCSDHHPIYRVTTDQGQQTL